MGRPQSVRSLIQMMKDRPQDFTADTHMLHHKPSGVAIWIGNGPSFYGWYRPIELGFRFSDKVRFWFAYRWWRDGYMQHLLSNQGRAA